jgi:hypothetical protein
LALKRFATGLFTTYQKKKYKTSLSSPSGPVSIRTMAAVVFAAIATLLQVVLRKNKQAILDVVVQSLYQLRWRRN